MAVYFLRNDLPRFKEPLAGESEYIHLHLL